jgi:hypothetical protein
MQGEASVTDIPFEIIANSPLAQIPMIFQAGQIPDDLLPKTAEDRAAISVLQSRVWPIDQMLVSKIAQTLEQRLPIQNLCLQLAVQILPFIRRAYRKTVGDQPGARQDSHSELRALASFIQFNLQAENPEYRADKKIYEILSHQQLWLIHVWPSSAEAPVAVSKEVLLKWLDGTFLLVAIMFQAYELLRWLSSADYPQKALEWLLGYEPCHDWYLLSELRRATRRGDKSLMACLTEWSHLPDVAPEDTPHYSGSNPEDRRMLYFAGEASLKNGWEEHPDPRAWMRAVAWNLRKRRKVEDESDHICAHAHGIKIVPEETSQKEREVYGRLGEAMNKPDRQSMFLTTAHQDPLAALLPSSKASIEDLHAAIDWQKHCRAIGLSDEATRLGLVRFVLARKDPGTQERMKPLDRELTADLLGIDVPRLKAKEQELRRMLPSLVEQLAAYGLGELGETKDI